MKDDPRVPTNKSTHLGPGPGRAMEVFRSSDSELASFCKLWAKDLLSHARIYDRTIRRILLCKVGHRIRPNVESEYIRRREFFLCVLIYLNDDTQNSIENFTATERERSS